MRGERVGEMLPVRCSRVPAAEHATCRPRETRDAGASPRGVRCSAVTVRYVDATVGAARAIARSSTGFSPYRASAARRVAASSSWA